jgi:predicted acetyltransferase
MAHRAVGGGGGSPERLSRGSPMQLVFPAREYLSSYAAALERGWWPDHILGEAAARAQREWIARDPEGFVGSLVDREAKGLPIRLKDGTEVPRLPGYHKWMSGTESLPPTCLGHIGYAVVPWKQRRGYATAALREILPEMAAEGLRYVEITTDPDNMPSQRVIEANGGVLVERFTRPASLGGTPGLRYRIALVTDVVSKEQP